MKITKIEKIHYDEPIPVYDVIDACPHHNFLLAGNTTNLVSHNCVVFDECNFAAAGIKDIAKSKERMKAKYDTLVARVTGTFVKNGEVFGKLYIISSKNSDSDFMEEYIQKQKQANNQHMYIFDKSQWEVWPASKYSSDKKFYIALGGKKLRSYVVPDNITPDGLKDIELQGYRLLQVPEDNKPRFLADFDIALRDIAGISVPGTLSYITQEIIDKCVGTRQNPFFTDIVAIGTQSHDEIYDYFHTEVINYPKTSCPLFIHVDLSLNTDRTGISGVAITGHRDVNVGDKTESIPTFSHIFSVALQAPNGDKIPYMKVLAFLLWLRDNQHFWVKMVTRDQFQSEYLAQELEKHGFGAVPKLSLDRTPDGYTAFRSVLTEERIDLLHCELLEDELIHLQRDTTTLIPDHPAGGCFTIDTKIQLVDGRILTIGELLLEQEYKTNWVYTVNETSLSIEPKQIKSVHRTKYVSTLMKVTLDNGEVITCTPEHRFMLRDGSYEEIQNLQPGTALMPLYTKVESYKDYRMCYQPNRQAWVEEHRAFCGCEIPKGYAVHHLNYNKADNSPTNLKVLSVSEHSRLHNLHTMDYTKTSKSVARWHKEHRGTAVYAARSKKISDAVNAHNMQDAKLQERKAAERARIRGIEQTFNVVWDELSTKEKNSYGLKYARIADPTLQQRISAAVSANHKLGKYENAKKALAGRVWYTNGADNVYIKAEDAPPEGFYRGRTYRPKQAGYKNHKIATIEIIHQPCDVYDLTIEDNPNFALAAGVFVHNSKDVADSVAGATWSAIQNSEVVTLPATSIASVIANVNGSRRNVMNSNGTVLPSALQALQNIKKRGI